MQGHESGIKRVVFNNSQHLTSPIGHPNEKVTLPEITLHLTASLAFYQSSKGVVAQRNLWPIR